MTGLKPIEGISSYSDIKAIESGSVSKLFIIILFAAILLIYSSDIYAQDNPKQTAIDPYELSLEQLGKIVITASKSPQYDSKVGAMMMF